MDQIQAFATTPEVLTTIEAALQQNGAVLRAFRSGTGLRVARVDSAQVAEAPATADSRKEWGYGEHPHAHEALRILADDLRAGCRPYDTVYGRTEPYYVTGASTPHDDLDAWLLNGRKLNAHFDAATQTYSVELVGMEQARTSMDIVQRVAVHGETIRWTDERGVTRVATPSQFPNGEPCCSTRIENLPPGMTEHHAAMWYAKRTGTAPTLAAAIQNAFAAPKVEIPDPI